MTPCLFIWQQCEPPTEPLSLCQRRRGDPLFLFAYNNFLRKSGVKKAAAAKMARIDLSHFSLSRKCQKWAFSGYAIKTSPALLSQKRRWILQHMHVNVLHIRDSRAMAIKTNFFFLPWKTPPKIAVVVGVMHNQFNRFTGKTVLLLNWSFYTGLLHFSLLPPPDLTPLKKDWITLGSQKTVTRSAIMCKTSIKSGVFGHPLPPSQVAIIFESIFILPSSAAALYVKPGGSV